jgi:hypothetical protein
MWNIQISFNRKNLFLQFNKGCPAIKGQNKKWANGVISGRNME